MYDFVQKEKVDRKKAAAQRGLRKANKTSKLKKKSNLQYAEVNGLIVKVK